MRMSAAFNYTDRRPLIEAQIPAQGQQTVCKALQGDLQGRPETGQTAGTFTAGEIAAVLGRTPRSIRRDLDGTRPDSARRIGGNETASFLVASLPERLRLALQAEAVKRGYASDEHLLSAPPDRWEPAASLSDLTDEDAEHARRLQRALLPTLRRMADPREQPADYLPAGLADYAREFGSAPSERHFRRLLDRTLTRDRGAEEWTRLEIYLPEAPARRKPRVVAVGVETRWESVLRESAFLMSKGELDHAARCLFWDAACAALSDALQSGVSERQARRELRGVIENKVPFISSRGRSLETQIRRLFHKWSKGGANARAVSDGRKANRGRPIKTALPEDFRDKLLARAIHSAGGLAQAWRESHEEGWMPEAVALAYTVGELPKSYVPPRLRRALGPEIERLAPHVIGPRNADLAGPYVERNYDAMPSGLEFQSDDCTLPVYFWIPDEDGRPQLNEKGRPILTRGQFLPWIDTRTSYIVTFQLIPEKTYDSIEIMRGIARLHDEYGLPETLYFERGIWGATLIDGSQHGRVPWKDFKFGLGHIGIRVRHANSPRAKIVERVLGALQDRMNRLRGYCGRDERRDCPENTKRALHAVTAGAAHPSEFFYSMPEWVAELEGICNAYNEAAQEGKLLAGLSPATAFVALRKSPPVQLPPELRYLLARSRVETTVKANGVEIRVGKRKFTYKDEKTSALVGERVLAWFSPEDPESICVTTLDHKAPFTVRRCTLVDAYDADPEQLARAMRENHAQTKHGRTLFGRLRKDFPEEFLRARRRMFMVPPQVETLGSDIEAQRAATDKTARAEERLRVRGAQAARRIGLSPQAQTMDSGRVAALTSLEKAGIKAINPYEE